MSDYIYELLEKTTKNEEIIRLFYLHQLSREQKKKYSTTALKEAGNRLISIIESTPTEDILDVIEVHKEEIQNITTGSIPQFSELEDADKIPDIVISNPNCKYKLIGYFFNKDAAEHSNQKYGENHYKLAAQLGLCEYADKHAEDGITKVSFLGLLYKDLPKERRDSIRPKLCLLVPFIQHILVEARHGEVNAMDELETLLTHVTAVRRRSSLQQMMHAIENTLTADKYIMDNIDWGYKRK